MTHQIWTSSKRARRTDGTKPYRKSLSILAGVGPKTNSALVEFEMDLVDIYERMKHLKMSYIVVIDKKTGGHEEKKGRINEVLRSAFTREEVSEASIKYKQYKEWLTATQEERRERELQDPDTFYPDVSFARYLADLSREERRLKRYKNLRHGEKRNLVSTRNYLKYCIKERGGSSKHQIPRPRLQTNHQSETRS